MQLDSESKIIDSKYFKVEKINSIHDFQKSIDPKTNCTYMHKFFSKFREISREECKNFYREIQILSKLNHPSIINFCGYCLSFSENCEKPAIFYEYVSNYNLSQIIWPDKKNKTTLKIDLNSTKILINLYGIASGMSYLHQNNIQHRNLCTENIFLDEKLYPKISGFQYSIEINSKSPKNLQIKGNVPYIAPEIVKEFNYSEKSDVYNYGIIVYELLTKQKFYPNIKSIEELTKEILKEGNRPKIDPTIPECYKRLIERCWSQDPKERPTFSDIIKELKNNNEFITESIDPEEYYQYIKYIDTSEISFKPQNLQQLDEFINEKLKSYRIIHSDYDLKFMIDPKDFNLNDISLVNILSLSDMHNTYLCKHKINNLKYMARVYKCEIRYFLRNEIINLCREVNIMMKLNHPSILKFVGFSQTDFYDYPRPVLIFQTFEDTLTLQNSKDYHWDDTKKLINMYGIAAGMSYLHQHNIVHRDLKASNIYLDESYYPKISGFNISKEISPNNNNISKHLKGTPAYLSPETYERNEYNEKSDVYSYSIIIYELITNHRAFEDQLTATEIRHIIIEEKSRPKIDPTIPECYKRLIERCWSQDPKERPTFSDIIKELKNNNEFITESIDPEEYYQYIKYIDEYNSTFDNSKQNAQLNDIIKAKLSTFRAVDDNFPPGNIYMTNTNNISISNKFFNMNDFEDVVKEEEEDEEEEEDYDTYGIINVNKDCFRFNKKINISTGDICICKEYIGNSAYIYRHTIFNFIRELKIMLELNHPAILKCIGFYPTKFSSIPTVITKYASKGPLSKMINIKPRNKSFSCFNDTKKLINMYGIAAGMSYLHQHNIVHRDLKASNIYLDESYYPKISGFNISKEITPNNNNISKHLKGTPAYLSPETYERNEYNEKSDVYSYSIIIYELITNHRAFEDQLTATEIRHIILEEKSRPKIDPTIPECYKKLIEQCWSQDPKERPTFSDIIKELKNNNEFITESIDPEEYYQYIKYIDTSEISFEPQDLHSIDDYYLSKIWQFPDFSNNSYFLNIYETESNNIILNLTKINLNNYKKQKVILNDEGLKIQEIKCEETGNYYDYKKPKFDISKETKNENIRNYLRNEVYYGTLLSHPSLLKMIGYSPIDLKNKANLTILYQHSIHGSLKQILEMERQNNCIDGWDDTSKLIFIYGIASCLSYLHSNDIIHYNLQPKNIFLDDYLFPKITGIRIYKEQYLNQLHSQYLSHLFFGTLGNTVYSSPEVLGNTVFDKSVDVFSFAMIAFEILSKQQPYKNKSFFYVKYKIMDGNRPEFNDNIPNCYRSLIERCWAQDPKERLNSDEIVFELKTNPEFITENIDKEKYYNYIKLIDESLTNKENKLEDHIQLKDYSFYKVRIHKHISNKVFSLNMGSIDINNFEKKNKIGSGSFGNVYKVSKKETNLIDAAKISKYEIYQCDQSTIINLKREIEIISQLNFPSIIKFIGYSPNNFKNKLKPVVITEFLPNGTLSDIIKLERQSCGNSDWDDTKKLINIYGIAAGMLYLHQHNIIHRDLKPDNILLDEYLFPKIADFGLSKQINSKNDIDLTQNKSGLKGTYAYCAPEILFENLYTIYGDVYAFGMIVYEIMTAETLYEGFNQYQLMIQILKRYRPSFKYPIPDCYRNLIESCWSEKYDSRPSFDKIVELLQTDKDFITENVDEDAFLDYVFYLNESISNDNSNHHQLLFNKVLISEQNQPKKSDDEFDSRKYDCFLNLSKFELDKIISKSDISKLYKVKEKSTGIIYQGEISMYEIDNVSKEEMTNFAKELTAILHYNHPTFLKFIGYSQIDFKNNKKPTIISELCLNNTLKDIIEFERNNKSVRGWNETKKLINIYGIASGMSYLHSKNIIHRNLKPENIYLDDYLFPKIGNFGLLNRFMNEDKMSHQSMTGLRCSPIYSAPEVMQSKIYSKKSDVYAFAFIIFQIISGDVPFKNLKSSNEVFNKIMNKCERPKMNESFPLCFKELIEKCWSQDPNERPSFEEISHHLRIDSRFISEKVNKDDYMKYIKEIELEDNAFRQLQKVVEKSDDSEKLTEVKESL